MSNEQLAAKLLAGRGWFPSAGSVPFDVARSLIAQALTAPTRDGDVGRDDVNPPEVWLSPACDLDADHGEGRSWAYPAPEAACEDCGKPWVRYVRAALATQREGADRV